MSKWTSDAALFSYFGVIVVGIGIIAILWSDQKKEKQFTAAGCVIETGLYYKNRGGYLQPVYRCNPGEMK